MSRVHRSLALVLALSAALLPVLGCTEAECATPDYSRAECRVLAENDLARLRSSSAVEIRFQDPEATEAGAGWSAQGLVRERGEVVAARVAHMGRFAMSFEPAPAVQGTVELTLELRNVHPQAELRLGPAGALAPVDGRLSGTKRRLELSIPAGETWWLRGELDCDRPYRILALADVQTNPTQFSRILDHIQQVELPEAEAAGELLTGVIMAGDLTEASREDEFRVFADLLEPAPVPFALAPGNHDIYESRLPYYNQNFGPGNYAFDLCTTHVAMLDSGSGAIADSVLGRLPQLFAKGDAQHSIAAMHHPPYAHLTSAGWSREDLAMITLGEFAQQGGDLILAGHAHLLTSFDEVPIAGGRVREIIAGTAGAWQGAGPPIYGYVRLSIEGEQLEACFVEVPPPGAPETDGGDLPLAACSGSL